LRPAPEALSGMGAKKQTIAYIMNYSFYPELRSAERIFLFDQLEQDGPFRSAAVPPLAKKRALVLFFLTPIGISYR
jgi:hypothetical protein